MILVWIVKLLSRNIKINNNKIKYFFQENNFNYLKIAFKNVFDGVILNDISDDFNLEPQNFSINHYGKLPGNKVEVEKVLIGTIKGKKFNYGTVMHVIARPKNRWGSLWWW